MKKLTPVQEGIRQAMWEHHRKTRKPNPEHIRLRQEKIEELKKIFLEGGYHDGKW